MSTVNERLKRNLGPSWCFTHGSAIPCGECDECKRKLSADHPWHGMCFDCKKEFADDKEQNVQMCSCLPGGVRLRPKHAYKYP